MEFGVEPKEKHRPLWPFLVAGAVIVVVLIFAFGLVSHHSAREAPGTKPLPFGPAEQSYAANVKFENLTMSRFENMFHQQVTYVMGDIQNEGNRTVGNLAITLEFRNIQNQVVFRQTVRPLGPNPTPLQPGQIQSFRLGFDQIPPDWNEQDPNIHVTGLVLH